MPVKVRPVGGGKNMASLLKMQKEEANEEKAQPNPKRKEKFQDLSSRQVKNLVKRCNNHKVVYNAQKTSEIDLKAKMEQAKIRAIAIFRAEKEKAQNKTSTVAAALSKIANNELLTKVSKENMTRSKLTMTFRKIKEAEGDSHYEVKLWNEKTLRSENEKSLMEKPRIVDDRLKEMMNSISDKFESIVDDINNEKRRSGLAS